MALVPWVLVGGVWESLSSGSGTVTPPPPPPPPPPTLYGGVGATITAGTYSMTTNQTVAAAGRLDGYVGEPLGLSAQRMYLGEGKWSLPKQISLLAPYGCKIQLCVKPSRALSSGERARLANCITAMNGYGIPYEITLWTEMNLGSPPNFPSGGVDYPAYWSYYAPTIIDAGVTCNFNPGTYAAQYGKGVTYGLALDPLPSRVYCDFYGNPGWKNGGRLDSVPAGVPMSFMALADSYLVPFGLAEMGIASAGAARLSSDDWNSYMSYIITLFTTRIADGKQNADLIPYCNGGIPGTDGTSNIVTGPDDLLTGNMVSPSTGLPYLGYKQLYQQLSAAVMG